MSLPPLPPEDLTSGSVVLVDACVIIPLLYSSSAAKAGILAALERLTATGASLVVLETTLYESLHATDSRELLSGWKNDVLSANIRMPVSLAYFEKVAANLEEAHLLLGDNRSGMRAGDLHLASALLSLQRKQLKCVSAYLLTADGHFTSSSFDVYPFSTYHVPSKGSKGDTGVTLSLVRLSCER